MTVRVRFAPSPTGFLHIGGVRTALFNWLFARHEKGVFVLRIEDTDRERSTEESIRQILEGMKWSGLDWDEGPAKTEGGEEVGAHGPYRQTTRLAIYQKYAEQLLASGHLYRCYCTPQELDERRKQAMAEKKAFRYDGRCRDKGLIPGMPFVLRLKVPTDGEVVVEDRVRGTVTFSNKELDDWVCVRSEGTPTYNFCVVIDDVTMKITHVIRGDDHLNNTPKQIHLFRALGAPLPVFAHLPMILGENRQGKLSKRDGAVSILDYRDLGFLPEATLNYLARLCWSSGDQEIFTIQELIEKFSIEGIGKSAAAFDMQKLAWVNNEHLKKLEDRKLLELSKPFFEQAGMSGKDPAWWLRMVKLMRERARTFAELRDSAVFLFREPEIDPKAKEKFLTPAIAAPLRELVEGMEKRQDWSEPALKPFFDEILAKYGLKMVALAQAVRVSITGKDVSPPIFDVLGLLGRETSLARLRSQLQAIPAIAP